MRRLPSLAVFCLLCPLPAAAEESKPWRAHEAVGTPEWLRFGLEHRMRFEHVANDYRASSSGSVTALVLRTLAHLGLSFDYMIELLGGLSVTAHRLDPSGERPLKMAKELRRRVLRDAGRRNAAKLRSEAQDHFGLPARPLEHWARAPEKLPWRAPEGSAPSPKALVHRTG